MRVFINTREWYPVLIASDKAGDYDAIRDMPKPVYDRHLAAIKAFNDSQDELQEWLEGNHGNERS